MFLYFYVVKSGLRSQIFFRRDRTSPPPSHRIAHVTVYFHSQHLWNHRKNRYWVLSYWRSISTRLLGQVRLCILLFIHLWVFVQVTPTFLSWPISLIPSPRLFLIVLKEIALDLWVRACEHDSCSHSQDPCYLLRRGQGCYIICTKEWDLVGLELHSCGV